MSRLTALIKSEMRPAWELKEKSTGLLGSRRAKHDFEDGTTVMQSPVKKGSMGYFFGALCGILFLIILVPLPMVVARSCTIVVVHSDGKPWPKVKISRGWAYGAPERLEDMQAGLDGQVNFNAQIERHSLLERFMANVGVLIVHGGHRIDDEYLIKFPEDYTAEIVSDAPFKWVYDEGHFAKVDFGGLPRNGHQQAKFILKKKTP